MCYNKMKKQRSAIKTVKDADNQSTDTQNNRETRKQKAKKRTRGGEAIAKG